ncbi:MAG: hypothetical protein EBW87_02635 [Burkholderiaceae bacterium]|nr:hypothetical protein [Burkholderiaceae bacterium]
MTIEEATPEHWATPAARWPDAILELRARVEQLEAGLKDEADCNKTCTFNIVDRVKALEAKYETMRLATLEWGEDVDKVKRWSDQHLQRIEKLEGTRRPASKGVRWWRGWREEFAMRTRSADFRPALRSARWLPGCASSKTAIWLQQPCLSRRPSDDPIHHPTAGVGAAVAHRA